MNHWLRVYCVLLSCVLLIGALASDISKAQEAPKGEQPANATPAATPALSVYPLGAVVDKEGTAFVVDRNLPGVWKYQADQLSVFIQGPKRFREPLNAIRCIALDQNGKLLVGDSSTRDIYRINDEGKPEPITGGQIGVPMSIAVKSDGTIYVADLELRKLMRIPAGGNKVEHVATVNPRGVYVDPENKVWVVSQDAEQLIIVGDDGQKEAVVNHRVFEFPHQVVVNSKGEAFVSDGYKKAIWKVVRGEEPKIVVEGAPLDNPVGLTLMNDQVVVTDPRAAKVMRLGSDNKLEVWFEIKR